MSQTPTDGVQSKGHPAGLSPLDPESTITFGPFRLDPTDASLWRSGRVVPLTPKAFAMLHWLARHTGRLVTKNTLLDSLWPRVFVGDAALKVCMAEVRRALGDKPRTPQYIETAHRRGYRFIAPVTEVVSRGHAMDDEPPPVTPLAPAEPRGWTPPETRYARSGDVNIAYQVVGDGPFDLVFVMGWVSHLDCFWTQPLFAKFLRRLASFSRLILFDKRGTGLSDRGGSLPTLEERMDDVRAVLDAVDSRRAVLLGVSEGGPVCSLFAATYPNKTAALVMIGTYAKRVWEPSYPWAPTREVRERFFEEIRTQWGGPVGIEERAPSLAADPAFRDWWGTYLRMGASPGAALALAKMNSEIDVRAVLPSVRVPTLVLHRTQDRCLKVDEGRYVASLIPGARFVELPGEDHLPFVGDQDALVDEIQEFVTGSRRGVVPDRVLATLVHLRLSPESAAEDQPVQDRLDRLEAHLATEIEWFRGRVLNAPVDTMLAMFDGPARAIRCAGAIISAAGRYQIQVRVGIHTGECCLTASGVCGPAVAIVAQISREAQVAEALVSRTVCDLVAGSGQAFEGRGSHVFANTQEVWELFAVDRTAVGS